MLVGVGERSRAVLERTGILAQLGAENVLPADPHLVASIEQGVNRGRALLSGLRSPASGETPREMTPGEPPSG